MAATKMLDKNNNWIIKDEGNETNDIVEQLRKKMPNLGWIKNVLDTSVRFGVGTYNPKTEGLPTSSNFYQYGTAIFFPLSDSYSGHHVILIANEVRDGTRIAIASYINNSWGLNGWQYVPTQKNTNEEEYIVLTNYAEGGNQTISSSNTFTKINLTTTDVSKGSKLTFNSTEKAVVIGVGVNHVEVSGGIYIATCGSTGLKQAIIMRNSDNAARCIKYLGNNYQTLDIAPNIISVSEGDKITLNAYCNGTTTTIGQGRDTTRLVVKAID